MEVDTLTQHPKVGSKHVVGGKNMEHSAQDFVFGDNFRIEDYKIVPVSFYLLK